VLYPLSQLFKLPAGGVKGIAVALNLGFDFFLTDPVFADFELIALGKVTAPNGDSARYCVSGQGKGH